MFWINPMKGPYYTLSLRFHQKDTARHRSYPPPPPPHPITSNPLWLLFFLFVFIFILLPFLPLLICFSFGVIVSECPAWLARGGSFRVACLPAEDDWLVAGKSFLVQRISDDRSVDADVSVSGHKGGVPSFLLRRGDKNTFVRLASEGSYVYLSFWSFMHA